MNLDTMYLRDVIADIKRKTTTKQKTNGAKIEFYNFKIDKIKKIGNDKKNPDKENDLRDQIVKLENLVKKLEAQQIDNNLLIIKCDKQDKALISINCGNTN